MTPLTLLLPLKGRPLHTMRFFWHANRQRLPHRIVVLDGEVESAIAERLAPPHALFPALDIDYVRCPDDRSYQQYFDKLAAGAARVRTPYVMLCDNDDFIAGAGVAYALDFLERRRDYIGVSGGVAGFSLHRHGEMPKVAGIIQSLGPLYHNGYTAADYADALLGDRVRRQFTRGYSMYYSVFRAEALATVLGECAAIGFSDLRAAETFFGARMKTLGKCRIDRRVISYVRQRGTSGGSAAVWTEADLRGPGSRAMEAARCLHALAGPIAAADDCDIAEVKTALRQLFADKLAAETPDAVTAQAPPPRWRDGVRAAARTMLPPGMIALRRRVLRRRAYAEIAAAMMEQGASAGNIAAARADLNAIEATLEGPEFPAFLRRHAPDLARSLGGGCRAARQRPDRGMTPARGAASGGPVSVIIPAFGAAGTIARAVRSVLAEPVVGEVIVVIDGPDDALREAVPVDGRVRVIVTPTRCGAPAARNRGLAAASGAFALFLDADDFVEGGLIASLAGAAAEADLALGSYAFAFASGDRIAVDVHRTIGVPTTINVLRAWFEGHYVPCCSVLWRTAFVRGVGGWNEDLLKNQDGELVWRASRAAPRMALADEGLGIYMQSPSVARVSNNRSASAFAQQMALLARVENEMTATEAPMLRATLAASYYRLARGAYYSGLTAIGRAAERAARRLDFAGHAGTLSHRVAAAVVGLRRKEHFCARLHRLEEALGLRAVTDGAAAAR